MLDDNTTAQAAVPICDGIAVLSGYGVRVHVDRRHLVLEDGCGLDRRSVRLSKAPTRLRRLVVLGHTGFISLEALRWLADSKAALIIIDSDGAVIATTAPQRINDSRLRRLQAVAIGSPVSVAITRELLTQKLDGQRGVLASLGLLTATTAGAFEEMLRRIESATTIDECLWAEAGAAAYYFRSWEGHIRVRFIQQDTDRVPEHWLAFGSRSSHLTAAPRSATDPVNAILNYLYALLLAETRVALLTFGLDPGLGYAHVDASNRDSLATDVMEAARPAVDSWLMEFLRARPVRARDFLEERDGRCRLTPAIAHELAQSVGRWRSTVAPIVEWLVDQLNAADRELSAIVGITPRKLSQRVVGVAGYRPRARVATTVDRRRKYESTLLTEPHCSNCGEVFRGKRCKQCGFAPVVADGDGDDRQRGVMMQRQRANREWTGFSQDRDFKRDILPGLQAVTLRRIMEATGLSKRFASQIRNGLAMPHARHWEALSELDTRKK